MGHLASLAMGVRDSRNTGHLLTIECGSADPGLKGKENASTAMMYRKRQKSNGLMGRSQ